VKLLQFNQLCDVNVRASQRVLVRNTNRAVLVIICYSLQNEVCFMSRLKECLDVVAELQQRSQNTKNQLLYQKQHFFVRKIRRRSAHEVWHMSVVKVKSELLMCTEQSPVDRARLMLAASSQHSGDSMNAVPSASVGSRLHGQHVVADCSVTATCRSTISARWTLARRYCRQAQTHAECPGGASATRDLRHITDNHLVSKTLVSIRLLG